MSAPRRLIEEGGTALEMALLRSAKDDGPPDGALERAMLAVGVSGGVAGTTAAVASGAAIRAPGSVARWLFEIFAWVTVGIVGGALFAGEIGAPSGSVGEPAAAAIAAENGAPAPPGESGAGVVAHNNADMNADGTSERADDAAPASAPERTSLTAPSALAPSPPSRARHQQQQQSTARDASKASNASRPTLAEEVALLDSARRSLINGNAAGALTALDKHGRDFASGSLGAEAAVLKIDAMVARGDRAGAAAAARAFLAAYPQSPHAGHVRDVLRAESEAAAAAKPEADALKREAPPEQ
jgi:hypothetical protein